MLTLSKPARETLRNILVDAALALHREIDEAEFFEMKIEIERAFRNARLGVEPKRFRVCIVGTRNVRVEKTVDALGTGEALRRVGRYFTQFHPRESVISANVQRL